MTQRIRTFAFSLAVLLPGALTPASASAWSFGNIVHRHPSVQTQDTRITVHLYNQSNQFQDVMIAGHIYTVMAHSGLSIKAPAGTEVFAETADFFHHKGDLLLSVIPDRNAGNVSIN